MALCHNLPIYLKQGRWICSWKILFPKVAFKHSLRHILLFDFFFFFSGTFSRTYWAPLVIWCSLLAFIFSQHEASVLIIVRFCTFSNIHLLLKPTHYMMSIAGFSLGFKCEGK